MRLIDADALKKEVLGLPNCYNGFSDTYDKACIIGVIDEQPTISPKTGYIEFAEWVAEEVMCEDFGDGFFAEAACRKLYRLGIITMDGDKWKLEREEVTE